MTTRSGRKWVVVHSSLGPFVARSNSPAAKEARAEQAPITKFRTMGGALACVRALREITSQRRHMQRQ